MTRDEDYQRLFVECRRLQTECERLLSIINSYQHTEDGEPIIPGREYWTTFSGSDDVAPWVPESRPPFGNGRLFASKEKAEAAK